MNKKELIEQIIGNLQQQLGSLVQASLAAREAATHEEAKPEDQYDTRGLEASYLAGAQSQRVMELQQTISILRNTPVREFSPKDPIAPTALVELVCQGRKSLYLIAPQSGGISVPMSGGKTVNVISPESPLGDELLGRKTGDEFEVETPTHTREYKIVSVE
jgi:hypothetical protein